MNSIENVLDEIDEMLDKAFTVPLSGKCMLDAEKVRDLIDEIRLHMPSEIKQAKAIVEDRVEIISTAKREAENIIRRTEDRAKAMIAQEEIVKQAQQRGSEILALAHQKSREVKQAASDFVENIMKKTDDCLTTNLTELRQTRQNLRSASKNIPTTTTPANQ